MKVNISNYPKKNDKRKIKVEISSHDCFSLDHTLAYVIAPALKRLKKEKHGAPTVDDEDVPEKLKRTSCKKKKKTEWDTDTNWFKRWDWVMNEMIFAFETINTNWEDKFHSGKIDIKFEKTGETIINPITKKKEETSTMVRGPKDTWKFDEKGHKIVADRIQNGFRLFGKYYQGLWD